MTMPMTELLPCGCYAGACYCGQYPTREALDTMEADSVLGKASNTMKPITTIADFKPFPALLTVYLDIHREFMDADEKYNKPRYDAIEQAMSAAEDALCKAADLFAKIQTAEALQAK